MGILRSLSSTPKFENIGNLIRLLHWRIMMHRNRLNLNTIIAVSALLLTASFAQAAGDNPLDPSYYSRKVTLTHAPRIGIGMPYSDSSNPLHPSFGRADDRGWEATVAAAGLPYVDRGNPLHPSYRKNQ
jgi:hypothetical protein